MTYNINPSRNIRGIEYPYQEKLNGYMFTLEGYKRIRTISGRGRGVDIVEVVYDSTYPVDLINKVLNEAKSAIGDAEKYHDWLVESGLFSKLTKEANPDYKLDAIQALMDSYLAESKDTPRSDKANKLLIELQQILDTNYE